MPVAPEALAPPPAERFQRLGYLPLVVADALERDAKGEGEDLRAGHVLAAVLVALYALTMGPWWTTVFAGTVTGYLAYDWMHYYSHHGRPFTRAGRFMRRYHAEHHFKIANSQYGLSSPLWDVVFGTFSTTGALKPGKEATADDPT